ncbi:MAG: YbaB/EbfC family nucleoid-associated protein [Patescibacteria group bacterium]|nr:YbaB/EbfC family nucleoid-associated protein [Patescibacteria group bacterium]
MFDKLKQAYDLKKQADTLKKELEKEIVEVESGEIKIRMSADQKVQEVTLGSNPDPRVLKDVFNKAVEESQKVAAKKMQSMMGGLGGLTDLLK